MPEDASGERPLDDLVLVGFAQSTPTLFPFVECQARLVAAHPAGRLLHL